jgi:coniferyl-aldehyde dehydrogenase
MAFISEQRAVATQAAPEPTVVATPTIPTEGVPSMDPLIPRMQATFAKQRDACLRAPFPSLQQRKDDLIALKKLLQRYQDLIPAAVSADFGGRAPAESKLVEVVGPVMEINHSLSALRGWMKPRRRHTELVFMSNSAWVEYQPKGVVGVIAPWNFPLYLSVGPLVAALAAGNRVMIKMSEFTPRCTELLARMLAESFPEDKVAVFGGEVEAAQAFSALPFNHIVFTGSPAVGVHVMRAAAANLTPVTLELGGKSPALVSSFADVADAAKRIAHGKTFNGGQICVAPDYALVPKQHMLPFITEVQASFRRMIPTLRDNHDYTSIITQRHADRIRELLADARAKGGTVIACGDDDTPKRIPLHIVTGVREDMLLAGEELFGPILPVIPYDSLDEAIGYINARPRPLALYPFGFPGDELRKITASTHSGGVSVNDWGWHAFNHDLPFGGSGNSGMGSYHGEEGFRELSHAKGIFKRHRWFPIGLFYPPYGNLVQQLVMKFYLGKGDTTLAPGSAPVQVRQG